MEEEIEALWLEFTKDKNLQRDKISLGIITQQDYEVYWKDKLAKLIAEIERLKA